VVLVDSGNVANRADVLGVMYRSMALMGYDAVGLGILEVGVGAEAETAAKEAGLPLVGALSTDTDEATPGRISRKVGDSTIGIVSAGWVPDPEVKEYREALRSLLEAARAESDLVVLLSQLGAEADNKLLSSEDFRDLADVVVGGPTTWQGTKPEVIGHTLLLPGLKKGREVGVLEVKVAGDHVEYHNEVITLAKDLPEDPQIAELVEKYYAERQEQAGEGRPAGGGEVAEGPPLPDIFTAAEQKLMRARGYLTADECGRCHEKQLEQWQSTPHARGLKALVDENRAVAECLVCHSEANRRGLPYDPAGADQYGVDCAACHGAGLFHASMKGAKDTIVRKPGEMLCRRCHTPDRDEKFVMETRLAAVTH
jgi:hypothetical protein